MNVKNVLKVWYWFVSGSISVSVSVSTFDFQIDPVFMNSY